MIGSLFDVRNYLSGRFVDDNPGVKENCTLLLKGRMKRVIVESPYKGDIPTNVAYAREALRDSLMRGEAPLASHLLYTQEGVLRDEIPEERALGIEAGLSWGG